MSTSLAPAEQHDKMSTVATQRWELMHDVGLSSIISAAVADISILGRQAAKVLRRDLLPALREVKRRYDNGQTINGIRSLDGFLRNLCLNPSTVRTWMMRERDEELKQLVGGIFVDTDISEPEPEREPVPTVSYVETPSKRPSVQTSPEKPKTSTSKISNRVTFPKLKADLKSQYGRTDLRTAASTPRNGRYDLVVYNLTVREVQILGQVLGKFSGARLPGD